MDGYLDGARRLPGRRPMTRLAGVGLAGHAFFELAAGVGMPFASVLGPVGAAGTWAVASGAAWQAAGRRPASGDPAFALLNGVGLAAVVAHLAGWPRRRTRLGLPYLTECEGLGPELMPAYNAVVYASGAAALAALVRENRSAPGYLPVLAVGAAPLLVVVQRAEFHRLLELARTRPGWWNRRLQRHPAGSG